MSKNKNIVICGLCGEPIIAPKGTQMGNLSREQQQFIHDGCLNKQHDIMNKHKIHPNAEVLVLLQGLIELHPGVEQTKPVFDYRNREDDMKEELLGAFPYLKKKEEEEVKLRKDAEEKPEEAKVMLEAKQHPDRFCSICQKRVGFCKHTRQRKAEEREELRNGMEHE